MRVVHFVSSAVFWAMLLAAPSARALDESAYADVLRRFTVGALGNSGTRVDYKALRTAPEWRALARQLDVSDPPALGSDEARLAFWINAYNILAIDLVVRHWPVESIRDIGSFLAPVWRQSAGKIGGRSYSLAEIEREVLAFADPRTRAALVCASNSCPTLNRVPYTEARLDKQLDRAARRFVSDPRKGVRIDTASATLYLSSLFKWFEDDFAPSGGVLAFVGKHANSESSSFVMRNAKRLRVVYMDYDWALNRYDYSAR